MRKSRGQPQPGAPASHNRMSGEQGHIELARTMLRKLAFESLYGPFAWAYDWVSRTFFLGQWRVWQRAAIPQLRGTRVLEVGMGTGNLQIDLARAGFHTWGVDLSTQMLRQARMKARRRKLPPFRACRAQAQALPFPDEAFHSVVSTFPSEYIADPHTLAELARVLARGGRLVVVLGGWLRPGGAKGKAMEGVARVVYGYNSTPTGGDAGAENLAQLTRQWRGWKHWFETINERMQDAGFATSQHIAANEKGACLIVLADKV